MPSLRQYRQPPVGVLARTKGLAVSLAAELGLSNAVPLSPDTLGTTCRGMALRALLVDDGLWPLSPPHLRVVRPALKLGGGDAMVLNRIDLRRPENHPQEALS